MSKQIWLGKAFNTFSTLSRHVSESIQWSIWGDTMLYQDPLYWKTRKIAGVFIGPYTALTPIYRPLFIAVMVRLEKLNE